MKSRERGGFLLGAFTTAALVVLFQAAMQPAEAMPPHSHAIGCHGPEKGHETKETR